MTLPGPDELKRLLAWTPAGGVLSVSVAIDPADRGGGWRVALEDAMRAVLAANDSAPHDTRLAMRHVAQAVLDRFHQDRPPEGRGHIGFVEVARKKGREMWSSSRMPPRRTEAVYGHRSYLRPVIEIADEGARIGVAGVSGDQVRLWEWELGELSEVADWEILTTGDWKERKAQRPSDPARVHGGKASGREQHAQRLEAHRERFLKQAGGQTSARSRERRWRDLLVFGENEHVGRFARSLDSQDPRHVHGKNIVSEPTSQIAERVEALLPDLNRERELKLVEQVKKSAFSGQERASLGPQETLEALVQGRVDHLLFDAERDYRGQGIEEGLAYEGPPVGEDGLPVAELMIERALETDARVTPLEGEAAAALDEHGGVAALLRY
jgi:hypothetical protein